MHCMIMFCHFHRCCGYHPYCSHVYLGIIAIIVIFHYDQYELLLFLPLLLHLDVRFLH